MSKHFRLTPDLFRLAVVVFIALGAATFAWRLVTAQEPADKPAGTADRWLTVTPDKGQNKNSSKIGEIQRRGTFTDAAEQAMFDEFYTKYYFPRWTLPEFRSRMPKLKDDPKDVKDTGTDVIKELRNILVMTGRAPAMQVHDHLNALVLDYMGRLAAAEKCAPATRINAMLMIGELNAAEPGIGVAGKPLPEAVAALLAAVKDPKMAEAVKVAALVGIARHAAAKIDDQETQQAVIDALVAVAATPAPEGKQPDGQSWMRGQAAEILATLRSVGANGAVPKALGRLMVDAKAPLSQRCIAARALGELDYSGGAAGLNATGAVGAMTRLAVDVLDGEKRDAASARRLKCRLQQILIGLKAMKELRGENADAAAAAIAEYCERLHDSLPGESLPGDDGFKKLHRTLEKLLKPK
jgi:hypothetical protein